MQIFKKTILLISTFGLSITSYFSYGDQTITLNMRTRTEKTPGNNQWQEETIVKDFDTERIALLICDVWEKHWCKTMTTRTERIAYKAAPIVESLRNRGAKIIHAPSGCMEYYRKKGIPVPIDARNCCPCKPRCKIGKTGPRQHPAIKTHEKDLVSDNVNEIWNLIEQHVIELVIIMGVHTNMCILNRPFGIKAMVKRGMPVVLVRDLTDAAYNPRQYPFVSKNEATELVVQWIEKCYCPSILSTDLL